MPAKRVPYPRGIVTFLFTDIVGSTRAARALPYQHYHLQLLQPQFAEIERLVEQVHHGRISGTPAGDSIMAAFADVNDALDCAVAIQNAIPNITHTDSVGKIWTLAARIGLHTSEAQVSPNERGEYLNHPDVIYAARIMSVAHGGQIVVSENGHRQADSKRWNWQAWGNRRVKGFEEAPQILHELLYPGWTSQEPGSQFLPAWFQELNRYVSRPGLENAILNLFQTKMPSGFLYRLVTLHGFGGMGKTRLAMQCCVQAAGIFEGRLHCAELDTLGVSETTRDVARRDFLAGRIAAALGIKGEAAAPDNLPHSLPRDVSLLLLLDNYETVKCGPAKRLVEKLLTANPLLHILITGRESVELERVELSKDVQGLEQKEARDLLIVRVRESKVNFDWTPKPEEETAIATILRMTASIPLAIELAAARVRKRTLPEIAAGISHAVLGEMTDSKEQREPDDPEWRHDALKKCYDWSWSLLEPEEQTAFALCSLFANDCAPEEITACFPFVTREHLDALQEASLFVYADVDGHSRYSLLHPTREYARKRLREIDDDRSAQRHFVAYYRYIVQENGGSENTEAPQKRARLEATWRHAASAAEVAAELEDVESCGAIADWLIHFVHRQAYWAEATFLYVQSLQVRQQALPEGHPDVARSLSNLALLYRSQGRYQEAEPLYVQALNIRRKVLPEGHPNITISLNNLAELYKAQGRYEEAEPLYKQALNIRCSTYSEQHRHVASRLNNLALLYKSQGRYAQAESLYVQALEIWRKVLPEGHPEIAQGLNNLAGLYKAQGRYEEAEPLYKQALEIKQQNLGKDHPSLATGLNNLAGLYESQGRYEEAEPLLQEALEIDRTALGENHPDYATALNNLAWLYRTQGRYSEAEPLFQQALNIRCNVLPGVHPDIAGSLNNLALLYESQGRYAQAEPLYKQALTIIVAGLGARHPDTVAVLDNFLKMLIDQERAEHARAFLAANPGLLETYALLLARQSA